MRGFQAAFLHLDRPINQFTVNILASFMRINKLRVNELKYVSFGTTWKGLVMAWKFFV